MLKAISSHYCDQCGVDIPVIEIAAPELTKCKIGYFGCPHCKDDYTTGFVFFGDPDSSDLAVFEAILDSRMSPMETMVSRGWYPVFVPGGRSHAH